MSNISIEDIIVGSERINKAQREIRLVVSTLLGNINIADHPELSKGERVLVFESDRPGYRGIRWRLAPSENAAILEIGEGQTFFVPNAEWSSPPSVMTIRFWLPALVEGVCDKYPEVARNLQFLTSANEKPSRKVFYKLFVPLPKDHREYGHAEGQDGTEALYRRVAESEPDLRIGQSVLVTVFSESVGADFYFKVETLEKHLSFEDGNTSWRLDATLRWADTSLQQSARISSQIPDFIQALEANGWIRD